MEKNKRRCNFSKDDFTYKLLLMSNVLRLPQWSVLRFEKKIIDLELQKLIYAISLIGYCHGSLESTNKPIWGYRWHNIGGIFGL